MIGMAQSTSFGAGSNISGFKSYQLCGNGEKLYNLTVPHPPNLKYGENITYLEGSLWDINKIAHVVYDSTQNTVSSYQLPIINYNQELRVTVIKCLTEKHLSNVLQGSQTG